MAIVTQTSDESTRQALMVMDEVLINATATAVSSSFALPVGRTIHSIWVKATSVGGTPNIKVYAEFAPEDVAGDYVGVEGAGENLAITDENPHVSELLWIAAAWGRIKVIGQAGNPADTVVTVFIMHD